MIRTSNFVLVGALVLAGSPAFAQVALTRQIVDRYEQAFPMRSDGHVVVQNTLGSITVVGTRHTDMKVVAERIVRGADDVAVQEGRNKATLLIEGNERAQSIRVVQPPADASRRWVAQFNYNIRMPQSADLTLSTGAGERIRITNIGGTLRVKNVTGDVNIIAPSGPMIVESINGSVRVNYLMTPAGNARLSSVNGDVHVTVPPNAAFKWRAETLRGEFLASIPIAGKFVPISAGRQYEGSVGNLPPAAPEINASSVTGAVILLRSGTEPAQAVAIREGGVPRPATRVAGGGVTAAASGDQPSSRHRERLVRPPAAQTFALQQSQVDGNFSFPPGVGNLFVGEVRGDVQILGRAGEIVLGQVMGTARIDSVGGPINIGDILGEASLRTGAGDILIRAARRGGTMATLGGNIQLVFAGGPVRLESGGGDITLRQAANQVQATTRSGDINVRVVDTARQQRIELATVGGNVQLVVPPGFGADIDAVVVTSPDGERNFISDFDGLTITREVSGNRVRIRATGRLNGGGERVILRAEEGSIFLRRADSAPSPR